MKENKIAGVYKITNKITGDFYVGSSKNIKYRWATHKCLSMWKQQPNSKLYQDMSQYGRDNFTIEVIEKTDNLREREQYWIEQLKPTYNDRHADGIDTDKYKEATRRCYKEYYESHRDEVLAYGKAYHQAHRDKYLAKMKAYSSRLCLYKGETLTLSALSNRFFRRGIPHAWTEAKKYLIQEETDDR